MIMLELRYTTWDGQSHRDRLKPGITRVGRTNDNDVQIDELAVSAHHCEFEVTENGALIRDLGSAGGTFLEGEWIEEKAVRGGEMIGLGTFLVKLVSVSEDQARGRPEQTQPIAAPRQLPDGTFSCLSHSSQRADFECGDCFGLFCRQCFSGPQQTKPVCPQCGHALSPVDWSGLERRREDVVWDLLPEGVRSAVQYWSKFNDRKSNDS